MEQSELLRLVAGSLEKLGIRYFVTGSMATIFFGEPRSRTGSPGSAWRRSGRKSCAAREPAP